MRLDQWLILALLLAMSAGMVWGMFRMLKPAAGRAMVCAACGHHGPTKLQAKGSTGLELGLWLLFLLPGLIYSLWRVSTKRQVCTACGADHLVPESSPVGRRFMQHR